LIKGNFILVICDKESLKKILIKNTKESCFEGGWQYHLRLGEEIYRTSDQLPLRLKIGQAVNLRPGEFALLLTEEEVELDDQTIGFISVRFTYKVRGLINISGFHIDPTYKGKIIFSVFNAGPIDIVVKRGDELFMAFFQKLDGKVPPEETRQSKGQRSYDSIPAEMMSNIKGTSATLRKNVERIERLESSNRTQTWAIGILATLLGGLIFKILFSNGL
jgi:dCTP deaminase